MIKYPNIEFDENLLTQSDEDAIRQNLEIASLNLQEFNRRNPEKDDIKFRYTRRNDNTPYFQRIQKNSYHYADEYLPLDWYITMLRNPQWHEEWIRLFSRRIFDSFKGEHRVIGDKSIELFNQLFRDFAPLGFLSEQNSVIFKEQMNIQCDLTEAYRGFDYKLHFVPST